MLTAVLIDSAEHGFCAPGSILAHPAFAARLQGAAAGLEISGWLADVSTPPGWPAVSRLSGIDASVLTWVDGPENLGLAVGAASLSGLLPLTDRLLVIRQPDGLILPADAALREFSGPAAHDYRLTQHLADGMALWSRPAGSELLAAITRDGSCDLHLHTNRSDGADSPETLVERVLDNGLAVFAITDHDNIAALAPAAACLAQKQAETGCNVRFIPGVELSVDFGRELHLLGYFPRGGHERIESFLAGQRETRRQRNLKMISKLQSLGFAVDLADFDAFGDGTIGRLQAALLLRDKGHFPSVDAAFDAVLGYGRPAYVDRPRPSAADAIWLIRQAGGVAVLAHPNLYNWCGGRAMVARRLLEQLSQLRASGLQGVEAFHGDADPGVQKEVAAAGRALGLILTAGSDDHGIHKSHAQMYRAGRHWLDKPEILVVAALVAGPPQSGRPAWLLARRSTPGAGQGCWELPGGKVEPGETPEKALVRELHEELNVRATAGARQMVLSFDYPERRVILVCLEAEFEEKTWQLSVHDEARFVTAGQALQMNLLPADVLLFEELSLS